MNREEFEATDFFKSMPDEMKLRSGKKYANLTLNGEFELFCLGFNAALASQAQQTEQEPYGYAVEDAYGDVKFFSKFDRPAEDFAFKFKTRKLVRLYTSPVPASQAQQASQWISVEERLPEEGVSVAVCVINPNFKNSEVFCGGTGKILHGNWANIGHAVATHWIPLPPAPEYQDTCTDGGKCGAGGYCKNCTQEPVKDE